MACATRRSDTARVRLSPAQADKRGLEVLGEQNEKQWKEMLAVQVANFGQERGALEARFGEAETRLASVVEQRDAEAASAVGLRERLAAIEREGLNLGERLGVAGSRLAEGKAHFAVEKAQLDAHLTSAAAARDEAVRLREATLAELSQLQAAHVAISAEKASAVPACHSIGIRVPFECRSCATRVPLECHSSSIPVPFECQSSATLLAPECRRSPLIASRRPLPAIDCRQTPRAASSK